MSIGATLAAARRRAGLTVTDVSQRTRFTEPIIRGSSTTTTPNTAATSTRGAYPRHRPRGRGGSGAADRGVRLDLASAKETTAAEAFQPGMPIRTRERRREPGRPSWACWCWPCSALPATSSSPASAGAYPAAASRPSRRARQPVRPTPRSRPRSYHRLLRVRSATASPPSSSPPHPVPSRPCPRPRDGRSARPERRTATTPQLAAQAIAGPGRALVSHWYATPGFAGLKTGTGLLVDMGRTVTISSVRLWLTTSSGASLQLRAGAKPVRAGCPRWPAPRIRRPRPAPARAPGARPLPVDLVHQLPQDSAATYQASVYQITVRGPALTRRELTIYHRG